MAWGSRLGHLGFVPANVVHSPLTSRIHSTCARAPTVRLRVSLRDRELEDLVTSSGKFPKTFEDAISEEEERRDMVSSAEEAVAEEPADEKVSAARSAFDYLWPRALLLLVAGIWGTNFGIVKLLDDSVRSSASAMARFGLAAVALSPAMIGASREVLFRGFDIGKYVFAGYFLQANALRYSDSNKIAFLCSLAVVFVPILNSLFPAKELEAEKKSAPILSILLAVSGVGLLELSSNAAPSIGDLLGLLQAVAFAAGFVANERAMAKYPTSVMPLSAAQLTTVGGLAGLWYLVDSLMLYGSFDLSGITIAASDPLIFGSLLYTGLITTAAAVVLENFALKKVSASELSVLLSTEPFFAAAFSAFFLDESLTTKGIFGGCLIIAACLSNQFSDVLTSKREWLMGLVPGMRPKAKSD
mmetsp:Transcript_10624/g.44245  ORF Transcript_10624/g.44245 Transcript_10624/m.44245 type:complete len:415 (-) Transcript_10624:183-1427(-)|eukprot:CAMPEP_0113954438 /NCGR_PEP_ID=MMETSP0011_2-20120614/543_1 /TAXON_ID=101924 /ORGANISM="Rhodosorus marinus" /LENGTH=414 /DNA_ID=CAMNT_0000963547 /DNA_START=243 /DNA_END=1487 /DNA_ORIENTATION=- /assembly_acc=CAM_ASM_000156